MATFRLQSERERTLAALQSPDFLKSGYLYVLQDDDSAKL